MEASVVSEFHADGMTGPVGSGQWAVLAEDVCPGRRRRPRPGARRRLSCQIEERGVGESGTG